MSTFTIYAAPAAHLDRAAMAMAEWRRRADGVVDDVDGGDPAAVAAILSGGLFGGVRYAEVSRVERLVVEPRWRDVDDVHLAATFTWQRVGDRKRIAHLEPVFDVVWCDDRWAAREIVAIFDRRGVTLDADARRLLVERCGDDLVRACSIAQGAVMAGINRLGGAQCKVLLGSQWPAGAVYEVVDAVLDGDGADAVRLGRDLDAVAVASNLAAQLSVAVAGCACSDPRALADACGVHEFVARKRIAAARRHGPERLSDALAATCACALAARRGRMTGVEVIARCVGALAGAQRNDH